MLRAAVNAANRTKKRTYNADAGRPLFSTNYHYYSSFSPINDCATDFESINAYNIYERLALVGFDSSFIQP